jgi:hypothetical protein
MLQGNQCTTILNKNVFFQNKELEVKTGAVWWLAPLVRKDWKDVGM